jgi:hypothetical protein
MGMKKMEDSLTQEDAARLFIKRLISRAYEGTADSEIRGLENLPP